MPLPVLAWYLSFRHNWCDALRSSITYSQVRLDSISPAIAPNPFAYRFGEYMGINLVYHVDASIKDAAASSPPARIRRRY